LPTCLGAFLLAQTPAQPASSEPPAATKAQSKPSAPSTPAPSSKESATAKGTTSAANAQYPLDAFKNFSAVMVGSVAGDEQESHIYRLGRLMRTEVGGSYAVTDLTKGDTYGVSPKGCLHDTHPAFRVFPFDVSSPARKVERAPSGKETVDGHSCNIEDVTVTSTGPAAHSLKMRFWEAEDLQGFPVKIEVLSSFGHNKTILYKDVVLVPPDAALFKHPANCQVLAPKDLPAVPMPTPSPKKLPASPPASNPQK
jgi:hypothetical protein